MATPNVFLAYSIGHCGARWWGLVLHSRKDEIFSLAEPARHIGCEGWRDWYPDLTEYRKHFPNSAWHKWTPTQRAMNVVALWSEEMHKGHKAVGFIVHADRPAMGDPLQAFCDKHKGRTLQIVRNPLAVVGFRTSKLDKGDEAQFIATVDLYASRYRKYLSRSHDWPVVKTEDMNRSVGTDGLYFCQTMSWWTGLEWTAGHWLDVRNGVPPDKRKFGDWGWMNDPEPSKHWGNMTVWQRDKFVERFAGIMLGLGYAWE
jgi:hypothetical protein